MGQLGQIALTVFDVVWLVAVLYLLTRHSISSAKRQDRLQQALIETAARAQENNRISSEAAQGLAQVLIALHHEGIQRAATGQATGQATAEQDVVTPDASAQ